MSEATQPKLEILSVWDEPSVLNVWAGFEAVGRIRVETVEGNIVITVEREDEAKFGLVSLVVV